MPLTITITEPSALPPRELIALGDMFHQLAGRRAVHPDIAAALQDRVPAVAVSPIESNETGCDSDGNEVRFPTADDTAYLKSVYGTPDPVPPAVDTASIFAHSAPLNQDGLNAALASAAAVPFPPAGASMPGVGAVERDAEGLPWDGRIHSSKRTKIANGTWKTKRGIDDAAVEAVKAELRGAMAAPAPASVPGVPIAPPVNPAFVPPNPPPIFPPPNPAFVAPVPGVVPIAPPIVVPAPPPAPPPASGAVTFPILMQRLTAGIATRSITPERISAAVQSVGLANLPLLASRPDLVPGVAAALGV